jgi:Tol biopolymer transport system component
MNRKRRSGVVFVLVLTTAILATSSTRAQDNTLSTAHQSSARIAFTSGLEGIEDVYVMNLDGSDLTNLTNRGDASDPAWSPDGSRFAFVGYRDAGDKIYIVDADGSNQIRLTNNDIYAPDEFPAWSPDGTQIAFASYRDGNWEIYLMNADGTDPVNLTHHSAADGQHGLSWSPDGTRIVFTSDRDTDKDRVGPSYFYNLYILDLETEAVFRLTDGQRDADVNPDWSPDGNQIVFASDRGFGAWWEIYTVNVNGSHLIQLTHENANELTYLYRFPAWSPDGSKIAYTACAEHYLVNCEIYIMDADGSNPVQVTDDENADLHPDWEPTDCDPPVR